MAVRSTVIKNTRTQAVIKAVCAGTGGFANISLQSLKLADETIDFANVAPVVNINAVYFSIDNDHVHIRRNGNSIMLLSGTENWKVASEMGFVDNEDNSANISIDFGASSNSTIYLSLTKAAGYQEPNTQVKR